MAEPHPEFNKFLNRALGDPETRAAYERAQQRARLCDDVQEAMRSVRWPHHGSPEGAAFVADKLWERGWRKP